MSRRARFEIEKFANDAFAVARDRIIARYSEKQNQILGQVARAGNIGGYVPALTKWAAERGREMILARADAYVEAFTLHGLPGYGQAEEALKTLATEIAAGSIAGVRGQLELMNKRTSVPLGDFCGYLNREIEAALQSAVKEGVLRLTRQSIKAKESVSLSEPCSLSNPKASEDQPQRRLSREGEMGGPVRSTWDEILAKNPLREDEKVGAVKCARKSAEMHSHPDSVSEVAPVSGGPDRASGRQRNFSKRPSDVITSQKRLNMLGRVKAELKIVQERKRLYVTLKMLKKDHPEFALWKLLPGREQEDLIVARSFVGLYKKGLLPAKTLIVARR